MKFIATFALLCALVVAAQAAPSDKVDCSKVYEVLDDLGGAQAITSMNDKYKISTNAEEQKKRCAEMTDAIKTLRKYNKECFSSLTQQVLSAILRTRSQFGEKYCKDPESAEFKKGVEAQKCIAEQSLDDIRAAEKKTIVALQLNQEAAIPDDKLRLRRTCCAVLDNRKEFLAATEVKCSAYKDMYAEYVDSYTSEAMGLICPDADKLDCAKLEAFKTDGVEPKSKFFLSPTVSIVKMLDH